MDREEARAGVGLGHRGGMLPDTVEVWNLDNDIVKSVAPFRGWRNLGGRAGASLTNG
jgi:hypothetical protein